MLLCNRFLERQRVICEALRMTTSDEPKWLSLHDIAHKVVNEGYVLRMGAERLDHLARTDPTWPVPPADCEGSGATRLLPWDDRLRTYFENRRDPEWLNLHQIAARVVEEHYVTTMSHQRVSVIARTDPDWPIPPEEYKRIGTATLVPWDDRLRRFWATRQAADGPKGWSRPLREKPATAETVPDTEVAAAFGLPVDLVPDLKPRRGNTWRRDDVDRVLQTRPAWLGNVVEARAEVARRLRDRTRRREKRRTDD